MIDVDYMRNKALYMAESEMKDYVQKYAKKNGITIDEALGHIVITNFRLYWQDKNE